MQRLLASATTADECRLIFDMFMARNGIPKVPKAQVVPYPSPTPSVIKHASHAGTDTSLESSLVELFLGGLVVSEVAAQLPDPISEPGDGLPNSEKLGIAENTDILPETSSIPVQMPLKA
jgi:hypothetical protein